MFRESFLLLGVARRLTNEFAIRGAAAFVALFAAVVAGLLFLLWMRRAIRRYSDSGKPLPRSSLPPGDDWARHPLNRSGSVERDEAVDELE